MNMISDIFSTLPQSVFWLWFSATVFIIAMMMFIPRLRGERNDLMYSFFAFLFAMAWLHIFVGIGTLTKDMTWTHIGFTGGLIGSGYTLKFPLADIKQPLRSILFYLTMVTALVISVWMFLAVHESSIMILVGYLYMIVTAGILAGGYIVFKGSQVKDRSGKIKAVGGGLGMMTCCFVADIWVLLSLFYGVTIFISGHFWMAIAPIIILSSVYWGRVMEAGSTE